jgi:hypothetical protein
VTPHGRRDANFQEAPFALFPQAESFGNGVLLTAQSSALNGLLRECLLAGRELDLPVAVNRYSLFSVFQRARFRLPVV